MDGLLKQERELELQIDTYKSQLSAVEAHSAQSSNQEMKQLQDDLSQLITLTEENLVELKRQRLLMMLQPLEGEGIGGVASTPGDDGEEVEAESGGQVVGMKCRAPLTESWGSVNYHNAMVLCVEPQDEEQEDVKVRVLFTQPLYRSMKPCSFFMDGSCKFTDEACKYSHGSVVPVSQLEAYHDHDFNLAHVGGKCLAKYSDDLWHPAVIRSMGEQFTVYYTDLNLQAKITPDNVYPIESFDDSESVSSDSDIGDAGDGVEDVRVLGWEQEEPQGSHRPLGEWEKHTTGFGSKLLAKMGYVPGQGLGKSRQGRVEPVEIVILPPGKSLDVCAEMREKKKLRGVDTERQRKKRRRKEKAAAMKAANEEEKMDMFDFLNTKIFKKSNAGQDGESLQQKQSKGTAIKSDNLNVRLFKVQEEIKTVKKRMLSLQQSLKRHQGRGGDKQMEAHVKEKLQVLERQLAQLHREEQTIEKSITSKTERKKLSVF